MHHVKRQEYKLYQIPLCTLTDQDDGVADRPCTFSVLSPTPILPLQCAVDAVQCATSTRDWLSVGEVEFLSISEEHRVADLSIVVKTGESEKVPIDSARLS